MNKTHQKPTHGSLEWLLLRNRIDGKCVFGASEIPALMGASDYETPMDLAIRKLQEPVVTEPNEAMVRGTYLEPSLISYAESLLGKIIVPEVMYQNGRVIATLDGLTENGKLIIEAKTTNSWSLNDDELPIAWQWQAQAQMFCTDLTKVMFVILDRNMRLGFVEIEANSQMIWELSEKAHEFGSLIDDDKIPDEPLTTKQVGILYPESNGTRELEPSEISILEMWQASKLALADAEKTEQECRDALINVLRETETATVMGQKVISYKTQKGRTSIDTKALEAEYPEIANKFKKQGNTFRVLRMFNTKGE